MFIIYAILKNQAVDLYVVPVTYPRTSKTYTLHVINFILFQKWWLMEIKCILINIQKVQNNKLQRSGFMQLWAPHMFTERNKQCYLTDLTKTIHSCANNNICSYPYSYLSSKWILFFCFIIIILKKFINLYFISFIF